MDRLNAAEEQGGQSMGSLGRPALVTVRPGASGMGGSAGMGVTSPDQSVILGATCATGGAPFPPL